MGLTWVVWGLMSCSILRTASMIFFSFHAHLTLVLIRWDLLLAHFLALVKWIKTIDFLLSWWLLCTGGPCTSWQPLGANILTSFYIPLGLGWVITWCNGNIFSSRHAYFDVDHMVSLAWWYTCTSHCCFTSWTIIKTHRHSQSATWVYKSVLICTGLLLCAWRKDVSHFSSFGTGGVSTCTSSSRWHIPVFVPFFLGPESRAWFLFRPDSGGIKPQHPWFSAFSTGRNPTSVANPAYCLCTCVGAAHPYQQSKTFSAHKNHCFLAITTW